MSIVVPWMLITPPPDDAYLIPAKKNPPPLPGAVGYWLSSYGGLDIIKLQLSGQLFPPNPP